MRNVRKRPHRFDWRAALHGSEDLGWGWFLAIALPLLVLSALVAGHPGIWGP